jgi:hypothetical protein
MIPHDGFILLACIDKPPKRQLWVAFFLCEAFNFLAVWACVLAARANIINRIS